MSITWWIYPEAGSIRGAALTQKNGSNTEVVLPQAGYAGEVHVILKAEDNGMPHVFAYRRVIIQTMR